MTTNTQTIRPGLMVALRTAVRGGVFYDRKDLPAQREGETKWETTRTVTDADELARATKIRSDARNLIVGACVRTPFALLCTVENEQTLDRKIAEAQAMVDAHEGRHTRVLLHVIKGRLETGDVQAARAVAAEIAELIARMDQGIRKVSVKDIRDAANMAAQMMPILTKERQQQVGLAIEEARKAARRIVARVEKQGEKLAVALEDVNMRKISRARMQFLDLSEPEPAAEPGKRAPRVEVRRMASVGED